VTAGAKPPVLESCEGGEYVIAVAFLDEGSTGEEAPVGIALERLGEGDTADELQLEGDLADAHALASTLEAEGSCVKVEIAQPEAEEIHEAGEAPESSEEAPVTSEGTPESGEEADVPDESPVPASP
jgi:hypothetical protein